MCVENKCAAYNFGTGLVGGDSDACTAGIQLTTNTDSRAPSAPALAGGSSSPTSLQLRKRGGHKRR